MDTQETRVAILLVMVINALTASNCWRIEVRDQTLYFYPCCVCSHCGRDTELYLYQRQTFWTNDLLVFSKLFYIIHLFFSQPSAWASHFECVCCSGCPLFFHLNGIRATHRLGYVDRLFLFRQHMVTSKWDPLKFRVIVLLEFLTR